jgi:hypothetical protein
LFAKYETEILDCFEGGPRQQPSNPAFFESVTKLPVTQTQRSSERRFRNCSLG